MEKTLEHYLALPWTFVLEPVTDDGAPYFLIRLQEHPRCMSDGATPEEAFQNIREAMVSHFEAMLEAGLPILEPLQKGDFKGAINYRTTRDRHYQLAREAQREGTSINKLIDRAVETYLQDKHA